MSRLQWLLISIFYILLSLILTSAMVLSQPFNNSMSLNGTQYFSTASSTLLNTNTVTVEAWIKTDGTGSTQQIMRLRSDGTSSGSIIDDGCELQIASDGNVMLNAYTPDNDSWPSCSTTNVDVCDGEWHHIAGIVDGQSLYLYVDGTLANSYTAPSTFSFESNKAQLFVGRHSAYTKYFNGTIDEFRISNIVRYSGSSYTVPAHAFTVDANTLALYHCDASSYNNGSTVTDACGNLNGRMVGFDVGDGSSSNPYHITDAGQLDNIRAFPDYNYVQMNDIDLGSFDYGDGLGWETIGTIDSTYNGQNFSIKNMTINRSSDDNLGLINTNYGTLQNITLKNVYILGELGIGGLLCDNEYIVTNCHTSGYVASSSGYIGGLIYYNNGNVTNCSASDSVVSNDYYVGGLISNNNATVTQSFATGTVLAGGANNVGGLIGNNYGSVSQCYTRDSVIGNTDVGGLIGYNDGSVSQCYTRDSVIGNTDVGGLIGYNDGSVSQCYTSGTLTGVSNVGGLTGETDGANIANSYWNKETICAIGIGSDDGGTTCTDTAGLTTAQMKIQSNYTGWNFTTVWEIVSGYTPRLRSNTDAALPVELSSFTATAANNKATLSWKTATETNNYGFEVERRVVSSQSSITAQTNSLTKVGFIAGNGTSNSPHNYSYTDANISSGTYAYRLKQIDNSGAYKYSSEAEVTVNLPTSYALGQNYPNPFNPTTTIQYDIPASGSQKLVTLKVYDVIGREVATLVNETKVAGSYQVTFNASRIASGVYFYKLTAGSFTQTKKLVLMK